MNNCSQLWKTGIYFPGINPLFKYYTKKKKERWLSLKINCS